MHVRWGLLAQTAGRHTLCNLTYEPVFGSSFMATESGKLCIMLRSQGNCLKTCDMEVLAMVASWKSGAKPGACTLFSLRPKAYCIAMSMGPFSYMSHRRRIYTIGDGNKCQGRCHGPA